MVSSAPADDEMGFQAYFPGYLARESWSLYAIGMVFVILRTVARLKRNGIKDLSADDYLMWVAVAWYTLLVACLNSIASGGGSNLYPPELHPHFTKEEIKERVHGSKVVVVSEQAMLNMIYTLKACMLLIYGRLTLQLKHRFYVKMLVVYVVCGYVGSQLAFFLQCSPFEGYWQVPPPHSQCATLKYYAITQAVFNVSSDLFMLAISIPLLATTNFPLKQKLVLLVLFGAGAFVIIAAILTKYFNLSNMFSITYMLWYVREASTAVYVTNLPLIWPLLRDTFPFLRSFTPGRYRSGSSHRWHHNAGNQSSTHPRQLATIGGGKASTNLTVAEHGVPLSSTSRRRDTSVSLESDERELYRHYLGGISQQTTVEVDQASLRHAEHGDLGEERKQNWQQEERGYRVHVRGGGSLDAGSTKQSIPRTLTSW